MQAALSETETLGNSAVVAAEPDLARIEWCSERYRSYRASDNSYQPYSGPRRRCEPPVVVSLPEPEQDKLSPDRQFAAEAAYTEDAHVQWCSDRYRSYNAQDNTYRSFRGHRRFCASPYI
ncbi:BA14K family protein [Pararhizobium gei]|uniref:BA14K family protein n=1 Tax=Pararhizobium gei TaxID=1395951 RepID=UPI0023DB0774|nr:BA14K family protein [Rhizobium gei]